VARAPEEDSVRYVLELIATFVTTGTAFALTAAVVSWWIVRNTMGRDAAECVLAFETTRLHGRRIAGAQPPAASRRRRHRPRPCAVSSWQNGAFV